MHIATLTSKGQITIPKDLRDKLNLQPGDKIRFTIKNDRELNLRALNTKIDDVAGMLNKYVTRSYTVEEMDEHLAKYFKETWT